jgi:O-acetyl-ADP-ribose deacetylase (regulator of RNase III)
MQSALDVGAAVVTGAGDLAASFVVHAVIQSDHTRSSPDSVRRALLSAWQRANDWELRSIATPLIGSGAGQLSLEDAATILAETLEEHRQRAQYPTDVQIVLEREVDRSAVEAVIARRPL